MIVSRYVMVVILASVVLAGCGSKPPDNPAPKVVEQFYEALANENYQKALSFYDDAFFAGMDKKDWLEKLKKRGKLQKVEVANSQADTRFSGKFYIFQLHTTYDGKPTRETLTLVWGINSDVIKIVGHKFDT